MASLTASFANNVRPLLDTIDRVREVLESADKIELPSIAVVGSQSSGKTSVLERLSGVNLPRGDGMVTRCALVLRMVSHAGEPYAVIKSGRDEQGAKIALADIARSVTELTDRLAKPDDISDETISLTVYNKDVPDLTLIDLPGIVYVDGSGKKTDIDERIKALYMTYLRKPSCVILCALPADADASTQQVKAWASEVDPTGARTLGVVTKIDKADKADASLANRLLGVGKNAWNFQLGAVAMRNRTQAELEQEASPADVDAAEAAYFKSNASLSALTASQKAAHLGAKALADRLTSIQGEAVQSALPGIRKDVAAALASTNARLAALPAACTSDADCAFMFHDIVARLGKVISEVHDADYRSVHKFAVARAAAADAAALDALHMMPRLQELLEAFDARVRGSAPIFCDEYQALVRREMGESKGCALPDKISDVVFRRLVGSMSDAMLAPAMDLLDSVHDYAAGFCNALREEHFKSFPSLDAAVHEAFDAFLAEKRERVARHIAEQIKMESEDYTMNDYFFATLDKVRGWKQRREEASADKNAWLTPWEDDVVGKCCDGLDTPVSSTKKGAQPNTLAPRPADQSDAADNFSKAVLETQIRLYCYRKVVHKRFIDQIACYVRLHFSRALRDELTPHLRRAVLAPASAQVGGAPIPLTTLMAVRCRACARANRARDRDHFTRPQPSSLSGARAAERGAQPPAGEHQAPRGRREGAQARRPARRRAAGRGGRAQEEGCRGPVR